jgi:putative ABC transport system permease protein
VDYEYRNALGAQLIAGRDFSPNISTDAGEAFIINETAAKQLGWENPIGKKLHLPFFERQGTVVGVINDFHYQSLHHAIEPLVVIMEPKFYAKLLVCYDSQDIPEVISTIRKVWEEIAPMYPFEYSFLDMDIDNLYGSERRTGLLLTIFSGLSIFIGGLGLFGLAAFIAEQKTKEIGIRKTLGASVTSIVILLTRNFTLWVIVSNLIACPIAYYAMTRWLQNFVYKVHIGYLVFATALGLALIITIVTVGFQAIKAAMANPVDSLRYE